LNRLDRNTSGLVVFSLSMKGAQAFTSMQREGRLGKSYLALLSGRLEGRRDWEDRLERDEKTLKSGLGEQGELARTSVLPLLAGEDASLALVRIQTGRTHQIRVQCSAHGHPLLGDGKYGGAGLPGGYFLHSWLLEFKEEIFPDVPRRVKAPIPAPWLSRFEAQWGREEVERKLVQAEAFNWQA
jgi:23S rRNA pseudouridine955/2504/2580 synthase